MPVYLFVFMKKLIGALLLTSLQPAMAVDYVRCEAMEKSASRLEQTKSSIKDSISEEWYKENNEMLYDRSVTANPSGSRKECVSEVILEDDDYTNKVSNVETKYNSKIRKIVADMKKEGCP